MTAAAAAEGHATFEFSHRGRLLRPMAALHKNTKWQCTLDCTHYCYHPELWQALLDGVYRRLLNHFGG